MERRRYADWVAGAIVACNLGGYGEAARRNLYSIGVEPLLDRHALLGMSRAQLAAGLPRLRGLTPAAGAG